MFFSVSEWNDNRSPLPGDTRAWFPHTARLDVAELQMVVESCGHIECYRHCTD